MLFILPKQHGQSTEGIAVEEIYHLLMQFVIGRLSLADLVTDRVSTEGAAVCSVFVRLRLFLLCLLTLCTCTSHDHSSPGI